MVSCKSKKENADWVKISKQNKKFQKNNVFTENLSVTFIIDYETLCTT